MNFQSLLKVENSKFYINLAFSYAKERAEAARPGIKGNRSVVEKSKTVELAKVEAVKNSLAKNLGNIVKNFPELKQLNDFYYSLLGCYVDIRELKKSFGSINWAVKKITEFYIEYSSKIKRAQNIKSVNSYRKMFYGRAASAMRQVNKNLEFLEATRKIMRNFPSIKEGIFTVAIAGFPNAGKSTLLNKLTGAHAEIANYAFTTRSLNLGYIMEEGKRIVQLIDTPGTLNRQDKMNYIEMQAHLAMKLCAELIVFVFDATDETEKQVKLYKKIKELGKKIIIYASKTDLAELDEKVRKIKPVADAGELKKNLLEFIKK